MIFSRPVEFSSLQQGYKKNKRTVADYDPFDEYFNRFYALYGIMPSKLPDNLKSLVIQQWLKGAQRDKIAGDNGDMPWEFLQQQMN